MTEHQSWANSRAQRLWAWVLRYSPSVEIVTGRAPTFREAEAQENSKPIYHAARHYRDAGQLAAATSLQATAAEASRDARALAGHEST